ncbi:hypothetical protein [Rhizobium leguminosarum]|uniref:hypothetical protein n=1 Tax=Rhizobium leguminosarum TaxID=384 RepID=UPI00102FEDE5|nr:hypothetical protein [Rhizobium leguminosarum]TAV89289.1 hypothetical protein ELI22_08720 [Rhizobium leguminosarum]TAV93869.1 hypothetical protein ELI21_08710 [Rhizobium leguminosarum]TAW34946.1 hypothetical protein ELI23_08750 [Rhizobium leguminosarum]
MQQLSMLDLMMPPPAPTVAEPLWLRTNLDKSGWSYGKIGIMPNGDGTWALNTRDSVGGYCGHGGPFWGEHASFKDALTAAVKMMHGRWADISVRMDDSCCQESHRRVARKGLDWLAGIEAEYGVSH